MAYPRSMGLVSVLVSLVLLAQAVSALGAALLDPPECRMVLVVTGGTITAYDCQGGETECTSTSYVCTKLKAGTQQEPWYTCRCCDPEDDDACWGASEHEGFCTVRIVHPQGQDPYMVCVDTGHCNNTQSCPQSPTPVTGVATCACQP